MHRAAPLARWRRGSRESSLPGSTFHWKRFSAPSGVRGATVAGTQVHSLRLPSFVIATDVVFGAEGERLSLRYDAGESATPYIAGTLLAIRAIPGRVGLTRGLDKLLF